MEHIYEDLTGIGISFVFVDEVIESLPEHVKTVVDYRSEKKSNINTSKKGNLLIKSLNHYHL